MSFSSSASRKRRNKVMCASFFRALELAKLVARSFKDINFLNNVLRRIYSDEVHFFIVQRYVLLN
jgi:hypothetical protein